MDIETRLRVAMIERADAWMQKNRVSPTWRLIDELRNEIVRMSRVTEGDIE